MKRIIDEGISPTAKTQIESGINQIFGSGKAADVATDFRERPRFV